MNPENGSLKMKIQAELHFHIYTNGKTTTQITILIEMGDEQKQQQQVTSSETFVYFIPINRDVSF